ncbi:hypothetical protein NUU61_008138 [Penicillium alfredii]|uniref:Uncharacterized protein n=1 Tax=Penicillium alfredii TaxID=1506179 RepID=A0A9W9ES35_9EURO|nr:uncharacterized protein NUU61_008138 [Penicillium alfredii]KAJ5086831.1 hypothetical protein NUU61_008138 [Penicillium alfredii]
MAIGLHTPAHDRNGRRASSRLASGTEYEIRHPVGTWRVMRSLSMIQVAAFVADIGNCFAHESAERPPQPGPARLPNIPIEQGLAEQQPETRNPPPNGIRITRTPTNSNSNTKSTTKSKDQ